MTAFNISEIIQKPYSTPPSHTINITTAFLGSCLMYFANSLSQFCRKLHGLNGQPAWCIIITFAITFILQNTEKSGFPPLIDRFTSKIQPQEAISGTGQNRNIDFLPNIADFLQNICLFIQKQISAQTLGALLGHWTPEKTSVHCIRFYLSASLWLI